MSAIRATIMKSGMMIQGESCGVVWAVRSEKVTTKSPASGLAYSENISIVTVSLVPSWVVV